RKNVDTLIESYARLLAAGRLEDDLVLAGALGWDSTGILDRAKAPDLRERVHLIGYVKDDDLPWLYRGASMFVYPSLYEGFGLPPLEAMACGVPVICSTGGALREMAGKAAALVQPGDTGELASQMTRVAGDPLLRASMREKGLAHAQQFQWSKTAEATLRVYAKALGAN